MTAEISRLDERILALADHKSPEEISQEIGGVISPAKVVTRTRQLLGSRDWLSLAEQEQMVLHKMRTALSKLEGQYFDMDNATVQLRFLKEIGGRLDKRRAAVDVDLNALYGNQAQIMGRAIDIALAYMKGALRSEVDPEKWEAALKEGLYHAQVELDKHQAVEA